MRSVSAHESTVAAMKDLQGKTAVITGAASGMGKAFSHRFAQAGMNVVMSDVEAPRLDEAVAEVAAHGTRVIGQITDVSDGAAVDELAALAFDEFGTVAVVCNNAGVAGMQCGPDFIDIPNWEWVIAVNLWGVIHGHRVFVPHMVARGEGHVINTSSMAGHIPGHSAYAASKWAVVGITQGLYNEMKRSETGVGVSCLCPGWVRTEIGRSERNQPESAAPPPLYERTAEQDERLGFVLAAIEGGKDPAEVADMVHDAVIDDQFWIFTDDAMQPIVRDKHRSIEECHNPTPLGLVDT